MEIQFVFMFMVITATMVTSENLNRKGKVESHEDLYYTSTSANNLMVSSMLQCSQKCLASKQSCVGANFNTVPHSGLFQCEMLHLINENAALVNRKGWIFMELESLVRIFTSDITFVLERHKLC